MSDQPDQLSQLLLEADGLLLLLHHHRDETPVDAIKLLRRKLQLILALTDGLDEWDENESDDNPDISNEIPSENICNVVNENETEDEFESQEENDSRISGTDDSHLQIDTQAEATFNIDNQSLDYYIEQSTELKEDINVDEDLQMNVPDDIGDYMEETVEHAAVPSDSESKDIQSAHSQISHQEKQIAPVLEEIDYEEPSFYKPVSNPGVVTDEVVFMNETTIESEKNTSNLKETDLLDSNTSHKRELERRFIDDAPIYKPRLHNDDDSSWISTTSDITASRRHVSSVFNLNDKFRFRRELFGNSDAQYVECLDLLSAMTSIEEAKEYLYDDLQWDAENEDVKAFIELLNNYYRR